MPHRYPALPHGDRVHIRAARRAIAAGGRGERLLRRRTRRLGARAVRRRPAPPRGCARHFGAPLPQRRAARGGSLRPRIPGYSRGGAGLAHAAYVFQNPGLSVADIAYRLDFSSPQSFSRHLKTLLGVTATEFRHRFPFDVALARFCDLLVTPYREALRAFHPLNAGMWDQGPTAAAAAFRAG